MKSLVVLLVLLGASHGARAADAGNVFLVTAPSAMWLPTSVTDGVEHGSLVIPGASELLTWGEPGREGYLKMAAFVRAWQPGKTFAKTPPNAALTYQRFGRAYHAVMVLTGASYDTQTDTVRFTADVLSIKDEPHGGTRLPNAVVAPQLYIDNIFSDLWDDIKSAADDVASDVESLAKEIAKGVTIAFNAVTQAAIDAYHGVVKGAEIVYREGITVEGDVYKLGDRVVDGVEHDGSILIGYVDDAAHYVAAEVDKVVEIVEANACRIIVGGVLDGALTFALGPEDITLSAAIEAGAQSAVTAAVTDVVKAVVPIISKLSKAKAPSDWEHYILNVVTSALSGAASGTGSGLLGDFSRMPAVVITSALTSALTTAVCQGLPSAPIPPTKVMPPTGIPQACWSTITTRTQDYLSVHPGRGPCYAYAAAVLDGLGATSAGCPAPMGAPAGTTTPHLFPPYQSAAAEFCPTGKGIQVQRADWGLNCNASDVGNATGALSIACNGEVGCSYQVLLSALGDPAVGCAKTFVAAYTCEDDENVYYAGGSVPGADNSIVQLSCRPHVDGQIAITQATYGGTQTGNYSSQVRAACDGQSSCTYTVSPSNGDPAPGQAKEFTAAYVCGSKPFVHYVDGPYPGSDGATVTLACNTLEDQELELLSATLGANCNAPTGNITLEIAAVLGSFGTQDVPIDYGTYGDPAVGCAKDFVATYHCGGQGSTLFYAGVPPDAGGRGSVRYQCSTPNPGHMRIVEATWGGNVGATRGTATNHARLSCDFATSCAYSASVADLGDPSVGTTKDWAVRYQCGADLTIHYQSPSGSTVNGVTAQLTCPPYTLTQGTMGIVHATYGANHNGTLGNATWFISQACNGKSSCSYTVNVNQLGDVAPVKTKDFEVEYECFGDTKHRTAYIPAEANGQTVNLDCN